MKMRFALQLLAAFIAHILTAQTSIQFAWMKGANVFNQPGTYGIQQVTASTNSPGARENSVSWTGPNNNTWLFGGHGYASTATQGYLNDLWKYNVSTNQWTWVSGSNTTNQHGTYGTKGVAAASNVPGARQNAYTWTDSNGNLWLFGGQGYAQSGPLSYLNDLWKFDTSTNQWTWISGSSGTITAGVYGTKGVSAASNVPSGRFGGVCWSDANNQLWLFGGQEYNSVVMRCNDLWKFNITNGMWTWMTGDSIADKNGVYGSKGVAAAGNAPGARQAACAWKDVSGNFWMLGGYGFPKNGNHSYLNDLWKYTTATNEWTWMHGSDTVNQPAIYGSMGVAGASTLPGARQMSVPFTDNNGNFWLFGGWGYVGPQFGRLNDLWKFDTGTLKWTWMAGNNLPDGNGIYGSQGSSSTTYLPGARRMAVSWTDTAGNFWLMGGNGYDAQDSLGLMNDLWKMDIGQVSASFAQDYSSFKKILKIYPQPANETLNLVFADENQHLLMLTDIHGKLVLTTSGTKTAQLYVAALPAGLYFLRGEGFFEKVLIGEQ